MRVVGPRGSGGPGGRRGSGGLGISLNTSGRKGGRGFDPRVAEGCSDTAFPAQSWTMSAGTSSDGDQARRTSAPTMKRGGRGRAASALGDWILCALSLWLAHDEAVFTTLSPAISAALGSGAGVIEPLVLPHALQSSVAPGRRSLRPAV